MKIFITDANPMVKQSFRGVMLEIARSNTNEYLSKLRSLTKPVQRLIDAGEFTVEQDVALTAEALAGTVLVGWETFKLPNGDEIAYSVENAKNLLINDPDCRKFVVDVSREAELFVKKHKEETAGK